MLLNNNSNKHISHVCDGLFVGSWISTKTKTLREFKIQTVISVGAFPTSPFAKGISYNVIHLDDNEKSVSDLIEILPETLSYIHDQLSSGKNLLIHCFAGQSRSITIVIAYLIKHKGMSLDEALTFVKNKRSVSRPNEAFLDVLKKLS